MVNSSSFFEQSTRILITRRIIQFEGEVYQFSNVTGFSFQKLNPDVIPLSKESTLPWLIVLVFSILYIYFLSSLVDFSEIYTLVAYIAVVVCVLKIAEIEGQPSFLKRERYGLILTLNSGDSKIFPSYDKEQILTVVEEIYAFMKEENTRNSISIEYKFDYSTNVGNLVLDRSRYNQYIDGDNVSGDVIRGDKVMREKSIYN